MQTANVQINNVYGCNEIQGTNKQGKAYTVREFDVAGFVDGNPVDHYCIKTLSGKMANQIQSGQLTQFMAEVDEFNGNVKYVTPRSMYTNQGYGGQQGGYQQNNQNNNQQNNQQKYNPPQQGNSGGYAQQPSGYTFQELVTLLQNCFTTFQVVAQSEDVAQRLASTLFIQCTKENIKAQAIQQPAMNNNMSDNIMGVINNTLQQRGLAQRVMQAGANDDMLIAWWNECQGNENSFAMRVNNELGA